MLKNKHVNKNTILKIQEFQTISEETELITCSVGQPVG